MKYSELIRQSIWRAGTAAMTFLLVTTAQISTASADAGAGEKLFRDQGCDACHQMTGPADPVPIAERASIKGPPLWFAGSKFKADWLEGWLQQPVPVRRVKYNTLEKGTSDHPAVSATDASDLAAFLAGQTDQELDTGVVPEGPLNRRKAFSAEKLFAKKQVCFGCHQYPSRRGEIGGFTGPSLVGAGARLSPDWVLMMIQDPKRYYPNGRMPVYGEQAFNQFSPEELATLAQLIAGM